MPLSLGPDWQSALWASPFRLRFELNTGGSYVNMFTGSYDRARTLARAALPSEAMIAIIAAYPNPKKQLGADWRNWKKATAFEILNEMGVPTKSPVKRWSGYWWAGEELDDEVEPWEHRAVRLTWDQADILLWNQVAHDMGITPQAPVVSKLVDLETGVSVSAYDDRGMDITALSKATISDLYDRFDRWLLDTDRPRMTAAFES